jgi:hypothetical protein
MAVAMTRRSREDDVRDRFEQEAGGHRMTVLREDGLYRHLRFSRPGTWSYGYDLVTWPGQLVVAGDCGDYAFARISDMFQFFRCDGGRINPDYWSEKLTNRDERAGTRRFSAESFRPRVLEWYREQCDDLDASEASSLLDALNEQVFDRAFDGPHSRDEAIRLLMEFKHERIEIYEPYDWSFEEWDWQFLWCCWAIVQGIAQYDWAKGWTA